MTTSEIKELIEMLNWIRESVVYDNKRQALSRIAEYKADLHTILMERLNHVAP